MLDGFRLCVYDDPMKSDELGSRLQMVRLVVLDVDGTLTDGGLIQTGDGFVGKRFDVRDGLGIRLLQRCGVQVGVITGRADRSVIQRLDELGVEERLRVLGASDKRRELGALAAKCEVPMTEVVAMGDDLPDLPMLSSAAVSVCPSDAPVEVRQRCDLVCRRAGGHGAVRELAERILKQQGRWEDLVNSFAEV